MAQQEEGWPLGLQPLNIRAGLVSNGDFSGSISFNTLITGSPTSSFDSSTDLDTESTGSFFHDKSITLGNLLGISNILELSRRSIRSRKLDTLKGKKKNMSKTWFSLCAKTQASGEITDNNTPSLGHFLEVERRASNAYRRNQDTVSYELNEFFGNQSVYHPSNSLFSNGLIVPPQDGVDESAILVGEVEKSSSWFAFDVGRRPDRDGDGCGVAVLFSCVCGQQQNTN